MPWRPVIGLCLVALCAHADRSVSRADEPAAAKADAPVDEAAKPIGQINFDLLAKDEAAKLEFFERQVRPLLVNNCQGCHGPDKQRGGLRLDSRQSMLDGGDSGAAIEPGRPDESTLVSAIGYQDKDLRMPPKSAGGKLSEEKIAALTAWVKLGAPWPEPAAAVRVPVVEGHKISDKDRSFWSFQPVIDRPLPAVKNAAWPKHNLDYFILSKLEEQNLAPVAPADKRTLLRRATFDLIGLPPTPEEIDAFLADESPYAFAKVVDRLLASPHYGERWARHWLDVARYGEDQAHSFQPRKYPDGFRYRDWVVKAFNTDMPYDRFVMEQIAGDLLEGPDRADRLAALGLFALGPVYYGKSPADELDDRVDTLGRGLLGLTVACARCHDHKFDPIPNEDYYSLAGIFASTDYKEYVLTPEGQIDDAAVQEPTDRTKKNKDKTMPERKPAIHSLTEGKPANLRINIRGNPENLGGEAPRRFLQVLSCQDAAPFTAGSGRLELAQAVASKDNPLTARVIVNRVWAQHFGRGLVGTPSNFGALGEAPTHPELLDHLAHWFMEHGWSFKQLHREIMLSAAYQLGSTYDPHAGELDPDNRLVWRMNRRRLEVEPWRDSMLAVSGNLDEKMGGAPADLSTGENNRRTLYGIVSRHNLDPVLRLFDFPDPNLTSDRRTMTSVPLQQLFVLNSEFIVRQAKAFAARLTTDPNESNESRIRRAFVLAFGRLPTDQETEIAIGYLNSAASAPSENNDTTPLTAWEKYSQILLATNEFTFVD